MRNKLLFFVMILFMAMTAGCKVVPDDPADYDVKFLKGEMSHVVVSFQVQDVPEKSDSWLMKMYDDFLKAYSIEAILAYSDLSTDSIKSFCSRDISGELFTIECKIFLPAAKTDLDKNFKVKLTGQLDGEKKKVFCPNEECPLADKYQTPDLLVQVEEVKTDLEKCEEIADEILSEETDGIDSQLLLVCIDLCNEDPTRSFCEPVDIDDDNNRGGDIVVTDPVDDETPKDGDNLLGYGGSCTLMPTGAGQGIAGILFMMISLVPAVLRRKLK